MLHQWIRCFYSDNGSLTDYSIEAQNSETIPFEIVAAQDYLYVGQNFPFNNLFIEVGTANTNASVLSIEYWNGNQWIGAVDVLDGTKLAGKSLAKSGVIQFSPLRDESWQVVYDTTDSNEPPQLSTLTIYNMYWIRLKWSANFSAATTVKNIGYCFTVHESLSGIDPDIDQYLTPWGGLSKTNWNDQILLASQHMVADLKSRQLVMTNAQVIRFDDVSLACSYRTLAIIYSGLGDPFKAKKDSALAEYTQLMNIKRFTLDSNADGFVDRKEIGMSTGRLIR